MANTKISAFTAETDVANITGFAAYKTVSGSSTNVRISGSEIESTLNLDNFAVGTLAVGRGGTGQTSYTDGQLLIGNTTGNTLAKATLTQGTDLIITNGNGSITLDHAAVSNTPTTNSTTLSAGGNFTAINSVTVSAQGHLTAQNTETYTLPSNSDTTYAISAADGDNTDEEKIVLTAGGSGSGTSTVVLEASTGLTIARSSDKITFTNSAPNQATPAAGSSAGELQYTNGSGVFQATSDMVYSTNQLKVQNTVYLDGDGTNAGIVKLGCEAAGASHYVGLEGPTHGGANSYIIKFPDADPAVGKILKVNSFSADKAVMEWADAGGTVTESFIIAASDETTDLATGTGKATFRMPYAFTLTAVRASVTTAPVGSVITVDINESGASVLSTKITIDAGEKTSTTAAVAPVISDSALSDDAEITIDIDTVGSSTAGTGLKVTLIGNQ